MAKKRVAKKKTAKKKVAKKKAAPKKKIPDAQEYEKQVPQSIKDRAARLAKRKAEEDKKRKENEKKIPEGAIVSVHEAARAAVKRTSGNEKDKFGWIEVLSKEIIRLSEENRALHRRIDKLHGVEK